GYIGASEGAFFIDVEVLELERETSNTAVQIGATGHRVYFMRNSLEAARWTFVTDDGTITSQYNMQGDREKLLFTWNASGWQLYAQGAEVASGTEVFTFPTDEIIHRGTQGVFHIYTEGLRKTHMSAAD